MSRPRRCLALRALAASAFTTAALVACLPAISLFLFVCARDGDIRHHR
jgi:hypothetical protein